MTHQHYHAESDSGVLKMLKKLPASAEARAGGYEGRYRMISTGMEISIENKCSLASRGLIMLENRAWQTCGGKPEGIPISKASDQMPQGATGHEHHH